MGRIVHALLLICGYVAMVYVALPRWIEPRVGRPLAFVVLLVVVFWLLLGVGLFRTANLKPRDVGWRFENLGGELVRGVFGFLVLSAAFAAVLAAFRDVGPKALLQAALAYTLSERLLFLVIGVAAAAAEETLFRGYLQPAAINRLGLAAGIVATAAVFSVAHLRFAVVGLVGKLVIGLVLGALRGRDRSLVAPAVAHILFWVLFGFL